MELMMVMEINFKLPLLGSIMNKKGKQ